MIQRVALLGSTGSIGCQTLDIAFRLNDQIEITVLTANRNWQLLCEQARQFMPDSVVIADKSLYENVRSRLADLPIKVYAGAESIEQIVCGTNIDTVVNAMVGYAGMHPSFQAVSHGKRLALANKESLVVAGELIVETALKNKATILPVDSEHSAILQSVVGEQSQPKRLIITASGGPFRTTPIDELQRVSVEQALNHPRWSMGAKITIDSATLVNKGFEVIEARWLFDMQADAIDVIVHPQSVVHSFVEFADGVLKAQLGVADMRIPIQYALTFPRRLPTATERFDFLSNPQLTFEAVDRAKFPMLDVAYDCLRRGGNRAAVMNAANEVAVAAFLDGRIAFTSIGRVIEQTLERVDFMAHPTLDDYSQTNLRACEVAAEILNKFII